MVGKTSISTRFIKGKFVKISAENRTINTNCYQKRIQLNYLIFNLNVWDTAGEENIMQWPQFFTEGRRVLL